MAHKTLIGGTAYEISGGKTLVNSTAYEIKNGKTLVGGTAYEVGFVEMVKVTLDLFSMLRDYGISVTIDGITYKNYASVRKTIKVPPGSMAIFSIVPQNCTCGNTKGNVNLSINNKLIKSTEGASLNYTYAINSDVTIYAPGMSEKRCGSCNGLSRSIDVQITEEQNKEIKRNDFCKN